uniref:Complement component c3a, duplicate 5 n=1 Tax=Lates calcarifer TaxID=8187 RepID=A0A4W6DRM3_LATCA
MILHGIEFCGSYSHTLLWLGLYFTCKWMVMTAPNVLRIGTSENIFVECQGCGDDDVTVEIRVMNHPTKTLRLQTKSVTLTKRGKFQGFGQITIPAETFNKEPNMKQYVYLQAQFPELQLLEKVVLVSFQSGYIFIQTDKTLYTPNSIVHYRMFAVTPRMEPVERDDTTDASIAIEIVTPEGITVSLGTVSPKSGIHSGDHKLHEIVSLGVWKLVAKFASNPQHSYCAEFEVKEYVLPSFEVKLTSESPFFHVDSPELTINIKAMYLFGKEVDGTAYVVFGVVHNNQRNSFPSSLQRVPIKEGQGKVKLIREHITQTKDINSLVGSNIFVAVSVLTESGGEMVEAELRNIRIVTSPYTIHFKKTPGYFKPGMSFDVVVEVLNPDGTPAKSVPVVVFPEETRGLTVDNGIARLTINTEPTVEPLTIIAKTDVDDIPQTSATMTAYPYTTATNSYIHIGVGEPEVELGKNLRINLNLNKPENAQNDVTYLISSKGQLMKYGHQKARTMIAITIPVTKDMLPSFRIIAYYHTNDNEVVSDSVWVDVKDSCMGSLKLEPTTGHSYEPGKKFGLKVTGDPEATVGLVAVDKGVFVLNNKHRLTQKKVWDIVEKYDTGCTPGGGRDSMSVFYDAGLLFKSSVASGTSYRQELKCPTHSRRKRANTILETRTMLESNYEEKKQRECCLEGMKDTPLLYNCKRRSEYITDDAACVEAFLHCCNKLESHRAEWKEESLLLARSEDDDKDDLGSDEIVSRSKFPESWLWTSVTLPACPEHTPNCGTTSHQMKEFPLKDSITTWQFIGISLSKHHSICVAKPLEVIVRKDFFIDLRLPYSVVRGEQLEIKAILHNYRDDPATVRVDLIEKDGVCSAASRRGRYRQEVTVGSHTTRSVPFVVIPMKEGQLEIEVKAAVRGMGIGDGVVKKLLVVPEGVLTTFVMSKTLDPAKKGGRHEEIMTSKIPLKDMVPNTPTSTLISVTGREQLGALVENAISGKSLGTLIRQPSGCGEQNMIGMTLPVIATTYLDKTNQWETVGLERRKEALQHIRTGYNNELVFRKSDGSFAVFTDYAGSSWLTAYVSKVFAMASKLVEVDSKIICDAIKFLTEAQQENGVFRDIGTVIHGEMIGDVRGTNSEVSMTAFCLIAMQESRTLCNGTVDGLKDSMDRAVAYLEGRQYNLTSAYAAAVTSYALANENKLDRQILSKFIAPELNHWPVGNSHLFTLEATAYALLALVKAKAFEEAQPVVRWFNQQQMDGGGYGTTQATIMVYQAIAEYWTSANEADYNVNIDIVLPERSSPVKINFNRQSHYTTRTSKITSINKNVTVIATGTGEATVQMVSLYYALPKEKESDCTKFNLSVELIPEKMIENEMVYKLKIEVLYKNEERNATMTILDIGLLTGYTVNKDDLNKLSKGYARTIARYEMDTALSEKGSLIIYLDKVSNKQADQVAFRIHQKLKVGILQPAAVSVYEYYDHQDNNHTRCMKFYHPQRRGGQLLRLCRNDECTCAEENCSMQKKGKITNDQRTAKSCESTPTSKIDYVYKVRLDEFTDGTSTDIYTMRVLEVIKEGSSDVGPLGKLRTFLSYRHCREALDLQKGKTYLLMGTSKDIHRDDENQSFQYVLGERTWVEYWPTEAECQADEHRPTCLGMEEMVQQYAFFGCQQ